MFLITIIKDTTMIFENRESEPDNLWKKSMLNQNLCCAILYHEVKKNYTFHLNKNHDEMILEITN
jgi:hypothetical protein